MGVCGARMTNKQLTVASLCLLSIVFGPTNVHAQNDEACRIVATARKVPQDGSSPCFLLAGFVWQMLTRAATAEILKPDSLPVGAIFSQRDLQNRMTHAPELTG